MTCCANGIPGLSASLLPGLSIARDVAPATLHGHTIYLLERVSSHHLHRGHGIELSGLRCWLHYTYDTEIRREVSM